MTVKSIASDLDALARELKLNLRQQALVEGLAEGLQGVEAARRAGYKGNNATLAVKASAALKTDKLARYMDALRKRGVVKSQARTAQHIVTRDRLIRRLWSQADADVGRYLVRDETGAVTGFQLPNGKTRAVRAVKLKTRVLKAEDGSEAVLEREMELRVADPVPAAGKIAELMGWTEPEDSRGDTMVQVNLLLQQATPQQLKAAVVSMLGSGA